MSGKNEPLCECTQFNVEQTQINKFNIFIRFKSPVFYLDSILLLNADFVQNSPVLTSECNLPC